MKILVTGGAGFIGCHVVKLFVKKYPNYHIINMDKLTYAGNLENLKEIENAPNYEFVKGDICDLVLVKEVFEKYHISNIFLVTPQTSDKRIREIDKNSNGFIYAVSSASTTGSKTDFSAAADYLGKLKGMNLNTPILTGFNIKNKQNFQDACKFVNGAIIGSEFIRQITDVDDIAHAAATFVASIK